MRKKILLVMIVLLMSGGLLFAQFSPVDTNNPSPISSLQSDASYGIFWNVIDYTVRPTADFSDFENDYLFGGLGNLSKQLETDGSTTFRFDDPATAGVDEYTGPYWAGFYKSGDMPWSVYAGLVHTATGSLPGDETEIVNYIDQYDNTAGATKEQILVGEEASTDYGSRLFNQIQDQGQFLIDIGGMITGLYVYMDITDNSPITDIGVNLAKTVTADDTDPTEDRNNYSQEYTNYYDENAGDNTVKATMKEDYSASIEEKDIDKTSIYNIGIPLFMMTGDMEHSARLGIGFNFDKDEESYTRDYTKAEGGTAYTFTDTLAHGLTANGLDTTIDLKYTLTMPAFLGGDSNSFYVNAHGDYVIHSQEYSYEEHTKDFDMPGDGTETLVAEYEETIEVTYSANPEFSFGAWSAHTFYYDMGGGINFGLMPTLSFDLSSTPGTGNSVTKTVRTIKDDQNADGDYADAGEEHTVITTEFTDANENGNDLTTTLQVSPAFSCPMSIEFKPEKWNFGVILGSKPSVSYTLTSVTTKTREYVETTEDKVADTSEVTGTASTSDITNVTNSWSVTADHNLGVFINVTENVRIDVDLNAQTLLDFSNFKVQAIIALP